MTAKSAAPTMVALYTVNLLNKNRHEKSFDRKCPLFRHAVIYFFDIKLLNKFIQHCNLYVYHKSIWAGLQCVDSWHPVG
jgi:hypothetical protein